ncbi:TetR-like C-terminal domain-containing protein [Pseudarthrobacter sp. S9]|uniref:TetR-like C-terminal domain-containing protein n=1 Tax=Pseudarthrobacter sp. S9 TaxID=3418421 RepID=UPI003CFD0543
MQLRLAEVRTPDPVLRARRRLAQSGRGYVDFALAEPGLFRLIFASNSVAAMALSRQHPGPFAMLGEILDDLFEVGFLNVEARIDAEVTCLAAMHGFSILNIDGPLQTATTRERETSLDRVLIAIDRSYAATSCARVGPHDLRADQSL